MASAWSAERRARQAAAIHRWAPWRTAGVRSTAGKAISRMNALKHGGRSALAKRLSTLLWRVEADIALLRDNREVRPRQRL